MSKATENNGKAIVFFHAGWCPMCQAAEKDFMENFDKVPSDVTILKTDYDTSTQLKSKYGITMQDTWVQVDASGNEITKWNSGGEGIKTLLANLK
ncbi:thioredoxin family protein [Candidatus Daviesbacteria bacterium]|nr:thioredoxin family protein [Candidatus Daviesbacteria bacterium]